MPFGRPPTAQEFQDYRVTNPNMSEVIRQPLYDWLIYPQAGIASLSFFQQQVGAGVTSSLGAVATTLKTLSDTNMNLGGQLPSGWSQMVECIEILFFPGSVATANTYTPATMVFFNAVAAATVGQQVNDSNTFYQAGLVEFNVLQKNYLRDTPSLKFVPRASFDLQGYVASNSATTSTYGAGLLRPGGEPYFLDPPVALAPAMNFAVNISYPGVVAMPSGFNARVGVVLAGYAYRASQ